MSNAFFINPDTDILANIISFIGNFAVQNICTRFSPFDTAEELLTTGQFDREKMLSFEDVTWDTVFAKMKTVQFSNEQSKTDNSPRDMAFFMDYADLVHDLDADALVDRFGEKSVAASGWICLEIWERLKAHLLQNIVETADINDLVNDLKTTVGPLVVESIKKYYNSDECDIDDELKLLSDQTREAFEKIEHDETAFFKVMYASLVKGTEVLICNPEYLQLGDRVMSAVKYYASGVSVTIGEKLSKNIDPSKFSMIDKNLPGVIEYIPTIISMVVTCAVVITVDKNPMMIALTDRFNEVPTITGNIALYRENAEAFEAMAAELAKIDLEELKQTIDGYNHLVCEMKSVDNPEELNKILLAYYKNSNKELPWGNRSLEEHWADKNSRLVFK